jgi:Cu-processing system permease protein
MNAASKILKYELYDVIRSRWIIIYSIILMLVTDLLFRFGGDSARIFVSLMNTILIVLPLVSCVFGTIFLYNSREFIELLLSQPISRKSLYFGIYAGLTLPLAVGYMVGVGIPFLLHAVWDLEKILSFLYLLAAGFFLILIFVAISFLIAGIFDDKVKGFGITILIWIFYAILFDGIHLMLIFYFADYPLEKFSIALTILNPIDLARILLLLRLDIAALMGYTGAVFHKFFGSSIGILTSISSLFLWSALPILLGMRKFTKKNL